MSIEQSITFFPVGHEFTVIGTNDYKELLFVIKDNTRGQRVKVKVKREMAQGVMAFIENEFKDDLIMTERTKMLEHKLSTANSSRKYYQRIADKKYEIYNREFENTKGRLKALEIEREVYLEANETLKGFLQRKATLIHNIINISKMAGGDDEKIKAIQDLITGDENR